MSVRTINSNLSMPSYRFFRSIQPMLALILALFGCRLKEPEADLLTTGISTGQLRGYFAVEADIKNRMLAPTLRDKFFLGDYLGDKDIRSGQVTGLSGFLGSYQGEKDSNKYRSGDPNALNMMLWNIVISGIATDASQHCLADGKPLAFRDTQFSTQLTKICTWPSPDAAQPETLAGLWDTVMGYDVPKSEFNSWKNAILSADSPMLKLSGADATYALVKSILMNPYFLIQH